VTKYLREINLKEERFILAHHFSPWSADSIAWGLRQDRLSWQQINEVEEAPHLMVARRQKDRKESLVTRFTL
jgi:hypothetical protein